MQANIQTHAAQLLVYFILILKVEEEEVEVEEQTIVRLLAVYTNMCMA